MSTKLPPIFEMNPEEVPMSGFPISNTLPIRGFNQICYNTAVEFIEGFDPDAVRNSKAGRYCKRSVNELYRKIGKDPCQKHIRVPVISLRRKFFAEGLKKFNGNAEMARKSCIRESEGHGQDPKWCDTAYYMYKKIYDEKLPPRPTPYAEAFTKTSPAVPTPSPSPSDEKPNCIVAGIIAGVLGFIFIIAMILVINSLLTTKTK